MRGQKVRGWGRGVSGQGERETTETRFKLPERRIESDIKKWIRGSQREGVMGGRMRRQIPISTTQGTTNYE